METEKCINIAPNDPYDNYGRTSAMLRLHDRRENNSHLGASEQRPTGLRAMFIRSGQFELPKMEILLGPVA